MWERRSWQRLAGEVRVAENAIVRAEKMAAYARLYKGMEWPTERIDEDGARFYCRSIMIAGSFLTINYKGKDMGGDGYGLDWGDHSKQPSDN